MKNKLPDFYDVRFMFEQDVVVDGQTFFFDGMAYLTGRSNGNWNLDTISGSIVEDGDYISINDQPELIAAFIKSLENNREFQIRADYETYYQI